MKVDYLIVGAGFSGLTLAERLCAAGYHCLVIDQRDHFGGNSIDQIDAAGVRIHRYGPHYFRTNSDRIWDYLSRFTEWIPQAYRVLVYTNGREFSFPVNLKTFEQLRGRPATEAEFEDYLRCNRLPIASPRNAEEAVLAGAGREIYRLFFEGYTRKQWGCEPSALDASVCQRIPLRTNRDDRYFDSKHQALPKDGYEGLFRRMVRRCGDRLDLRLKTSWESIRGTVKARQVFFSGAIDAYYDYEYGPLPYRSLRFEFESFDARALRRRAKVSARPGYWQQALQINYPNDHAYTRIVEIKHATRQETPNSTIAREYPMAYARGREPFYPVPSEASRALYRRYAERAAADPEVTFLGRLGRYRYYNMDQVVGEALGVAERTIAARSERVPVASIHAEALV